MVYVFSTLIIFLATALSAFAETGIRQSKRHHPQQLLVKFRSEASAYEESGTTMMGRVGQSRNLRLVHVDAPEDLESTLENYRRDPDVVYAEPDYILEAFATPNDPHYGVLYGMEKIGAPKAWDITKGTGETIVAVIDTGVDWNHPDLKANIWKNEDEIPGNGIDDDKNGFIDDDKGWDFGDRDNNPSDPDGHGTHVAGTIGASGNNATGVVGVNWNVKIMPIKFLEGTYGGYTSTAIASLRYAVQNGAKVSNNSWGGPNFSQALLDEIKAARAAGHVFVAAAGNSTTDNDTSPVYPASYDSDNVVTVASTNINEIMSGFSCYGLNSVHLGAPGSGIRSTVPGGYGDKSGTSMASPHVAGAIALLWDKFPSLSYSEVKSQIMYSGDLLPALEGKTVTGRRLNIPNALGASGGHTGATAKALAATELRLSWTNAAGTHKSIVERTLTPANAKSWAKVAEIPGSTATYDDKGLEEGKQYVYRVRSVKAQGNFGVTAEFLGKLTKPAAPTDLRVVTASSTKVELAWTDKSDDESGMKVERGLAAGGPYTVVADLAANAKAHVDTGIEAGKTYYYRVSAVNPVGPSASNEANAVINEGTAATPTPTPEATPEGEESPTALQVDAGSPQPASVQNKKCLFVSFFQGTSREGELSQVRALRDRYLKPYALGRLVIRAYYGASPKLIEATDASPELKGVLGYGLGGVLTLASR